MLTIMKRRAPFLVAAAVSLGIGVIAGLTRLGWEFSLSPAVPQHGSIMVGAFLGTLISLEKIIALKNPKLYVIPALSAMSVVAFLLESVVIGYSLLIMASTGLTLVFVMYLWRERSVIYLLMSIGAFCWLTGNSILMLTFSFPGAISWWMAFILLIISAERVEVMKFLPVTRTNKSIFASLLLSFVLSAVISFHHGGQLVAGAVLIMVAMWLMKNDVIGISIRKNGLTRFVAVTLLCGYIALLFTGVLMLTLSTQPYAYDIVVHTFFIGFVFSMIFAHGPIIIPGVLGLSVKPFHPIVYLWVTLLQLSLMTRIAGGLLFNFEIRKMSGLLSGISIFGYLATMAFVSYNHVQAHAKVR